jgi:hypothetical protein
MVQQLARRGIGDVCVVEQEQPETSLLGAATDRARERLEQVLAVRRCIAARGLRRRQELADGIEERRERPVALRLVEGHVEGARGEWTEAPAQLLEQARLAHAGLAEHQHDAAAPLESDLVGDQTQARDLPVAPDEQTWLCRRSESRGSGEHGRGAGRGERRRGGRGGPGCRTGGPGPWRGRQRRSPLQLAR